MKHKLNRSHPIWVSSLSRGFSRADILKAAGAVFVSIGFLAPVAAQTFRVSSAIISNGTIQVTFPGRADSYYFLRAASSLGATSAPVAAMLGTNGNQTFVRPLSGSTAMFFRVQSLFQSGVNDQDNDGIADAWELQHGINPLNPSDAAQTVPGDTRTWLGVYQDYLNTLPLEAWFTTPESLALSYSSGTNAPATVNVQVRFTRPVTGTYQYQVSGTALGALDFQPLSGQLQINNSATAVIPVQPVPSPSLKGPRNLVLALRRPGTNVVSAINAAATGGTIDRFASHNLTIRDADQGLYSGNLSFLSQTTRTVSNGQTNISIIPAPSIGPSTFTMALRSGTPLSVAVLEMPECVLFGTNRLSMPVILSGNLLGFSTAAAIHGNTPLPQLVNRSVFWNLQFTSFAFTNQGTAFSAECRITVTGLSASGQPLILNGTISANRLDP